MHDSVYFKAEQFPLNLNNECQNLETVQAAAVVFFSCFIQALYGILYLAKFSLSSSSSGFKSVAHVVVTDMETFAQEAAIQEFLFLLQSSYCRVQTRMCSFRDFICRKQLCTFVMTTKKGEDNIFPQK